MNTQEITMLPNDNNNSHITKTNNNLVLDDDDEMDDDEYYYSLDHESATALVDMLSSDSDITPILSSSSSSAAAVAPAPAPVKQQPSTSTSTRNPSQRRRSRASKKAPTTLLKSSPKNFRAVVQQFTGFRTTAATTSTRIGKGPINLNFAQYGQEDPHPHRYPPPQSSESAPTIPNLYSLASATNSTTIASTTSLPRPPHHHHQMFASSNSSPTPPAPSLPSLDIDMNMETLPLPASPPDYYSALPAEPSWHQYHHNDFWRQN